MSWKYIENKDELEEFYHTILPAIREVARNLGYALVAHGSMRRDMDLIAVPWVDNFSDKNELAAAIQKEACGMIRSSYTWEQKPGQRFATAFPICLTWHEEPMILSNGHVDLSVIEWSKP